MTSIVLPVYHDPTPYDTTSEWTATIANAIVDKLQGSDDVVRVVSVLPVTSGAITIGGINADLRQNQDGYNVLRIRQEGNAPDLSFYDGTYEITFKRPALAASSSYTFPATQGAANTYLKTDAAGVLSWAAGGAGVSVHADLTGLAADDHTQYLLLAGRAGGQVISPVAGENVLSVNTGSGRAIVSCATGSLTANNSLAYLYSTASQTNADTHLLSIVASHADSTFELVSIVSAAPSSTAIYVASDGYGLIIDSTSANSSVLLNQNEPLANNEATLYIYSNQVNDDASQSLFKIINDHADSENRCIYAETHGHGTSLYIKSTASTTIDYVVYIEGATTDHELIRVNCNGVLGNWCAGLSFYSNVAQVNTSSLFVLTQDNAGSTAKVGWIINDGTGIGLTIDQNGVLASNMAGLRVYSDAAQTNSVLIEAINDNANSTKGLLQMTDDSVGTGYSYKFISTSTTTGHCFGITSAGRYHTLHAYSTGTAGDGGAMVYFHHNNSSAIVPALYVRATGTVMAIEANTTNSGASGGFKATNAGYYPDMWLYNTNTGANKDTYGSLYIDAVGSASKPSISFNGHTIYTGKTAVDEYIKVCKTSNVVRYIRLYS